MFSAEHKLLEYIRHGRHKSHGMAAYGGLTSLEQDNVIVKISQEIDALTGKINRLIPKVRKSSSGQNCFAVFFLCTPKDQLRQTNQRLERANQILTELKTQRRPENEDLPEVKRALELTSIRRGCDDC